MQGAGREKGDGSDGDRRHRRRLLRHQRVLAFTARFLCGRRAASRFVCETSSALTATRRGSMTISSSLQTGRSLAR